MSGVIYNPPDEYLNIFNPINYFYDTGAGISISTADARYLKKAGDTATGIINFSNGLATADGTNGTPYGLSFINDTNTGYYRIGADNLGISCGGVKQIDISTTLTTFTNPLRLADGGFTFSSSTNTGITYTGGNRILVSNGGSQTFSFANGGVNQSNLPISLPTQTAGAPTIRGLTAGITTTGLFFKIAPSLGVSVNGIERVDFTSTTASYSVPINMNSNNIINAPQVGNTAGNLELAVNSTGAGGTITLTGGTDLLQGTAGGSSGQHLKLIINGTIYKIALLNN